jgi:DNA-binding MarR family transcriptional regulator
MSTARETLFLSLLLRLQRSGPGYPPFEDTGITPAQFAYLDCVASHPQINVQEITTALSVSAASVSTAIKHLEQIGMLQREPNPLDGRSCCFTLSAAGREVHQCITQFRQQKAQTLLNHLTETEQEQFLLFFEQLLTNETPFLNSDKE